MIKAVFFDVDGTLISHTQKAVPESTKTALEALEKKGIRRVIATGRHMLELQMLPVNSISFDGYITLNGQLCLDAKGEILSGTPITGQDKDTILRVFREKSIPVVLVEKDRLYINFINEYVVSAQEAISTPLPTVGEYTGNEIYLAVAYLEKEREKDLPMLLKNCKATRWNDYGMDIFCASGGKTAGIREYLDTNHILLEQTMAFGDGENDMDMLKFVHIGVAMGNSEDAVKDCADYVTASVDDDGIFKALKELKIID